MKYYIDVDLGTSVLKLLLINSEGKVLNTVSKSYNVLSVKYIKTSMNFIEVLVYL